MKKKRFDDEFGSGDDVIDGEVPVATGRKSEDYYKTFAGNSDDGFKVRNTTPMGLLRSGGRNLCSTLNVLAFSLMIRDRILLNTLFFYKIVSEKQNGIVRYNKTSMALSDSRKNITLKV